MNQIATEANIGQIVVTAGHIPVEWASRHDAPKVLTAGVRFILKGVEGVKGFFYRDDMGVLRFNLNATDFYER